MMHYCAQLNFSFVLATSLHGPVQGLHQLQMALVPDIIRRQTAACAASESTSGGGVYVTRPHGCWNVSSWLCEEYEYNTVSVV